jgi:hypothetical protein
MTDEQIALGLDLFAANWVRSELQNRHLIATALMVSPQKGQALLSGSMFAPFR